MWRMATAAHTLRPNPSPTARRSALVALWTVLAVVLAAVAGQARANLGLLVDAAGFALVAVGVGVLWGSGAGLVAAGVGVLVLRDFGGDATTRR